MSESGLAVKAVVAPIAPSVDTHSEARTRGRAFDQCSCIRLNHVDRNLASQKLA